MDTFMRFLYEFLSQFFSGFGIIFKGIGSGLWEMINIGAYRNILENYKNDLSAPEGNSKYRFEKKLTDSKGI